jgi:hypothetical protein
MIEQHRRLQVDVSATSVWPQTRSLSTPHGIFASLAMTMWRNSALPPSYKGKGRSSRHTPYRAQPFDHAPNLRGQARLAEIKSLHRGAAAFADEVELVRRFDAFRRRLDAEHGT